MVEEILEIKIEDIKIRPERFRRDFGEVEILAESIKRLGLLHPIIIDDKNNLVAGERRLRAHMLLGLPTIKARKLSSLSNRDKRIIELEENIRRKDLTWQEDVIAKVILFDLYVEEKGKGVRNKAGGFTIKDFADMLGVSFGTAHRDLEIGRKLLEEIGGNIKDKIKTKNIERVSEVVDETLKELDKKDNKFFALKTKEAAYRLIKGEEELKARKALVDIDVIIKKKFGVENSVECRLGDGIKGLSELDNDSVDLILTDPPWGVNLDDSYYNSEYLDEVGVDNYGDIDWWEPFLREAFRVMKPESHMYIFFGIVHIQKLRDMLTKIGFEYDPIPLVWYKRNAYNHFPYIRFTHDVEFIKFIYKGKRRMSKVRGCLFDFAPIQPALKIHIAEKPIPLLEELISLSTIEGELVVDPFCGSGSTLIAARNLGRRGLGWEINEKHYYGIVERLKSTSNKQDNS